MPARGIDAKPWKSFSIREPYGWKVTGRGCADVHPDG
jgi:hypothetical protein